LLQEMRRKRKGNNCHVRRRNARIHLCSNDF
jgi:hypothetical protein